MTTLGVILAGGRGRRLGLGPKALVRLGDLTLLERARQVLAPRCDRVLVCAPAAIAAALPAADLVHDSGDGPLAGLVAAWSGRAFTRALVLGVDFPFVQGALLDGLIARLIPPLDGLANCDAVVPAPGGVPQPLVAVYAAGVATAFADAFARGERSPSRALAALRVDVVDDAALRALDPASDVAFNLNTPTDLLDAERRLRTEAA